MECIAKVLLERYKIPKETVDKFLEKEKDTDKNMMQSFKGMDLDQDKKMSYDELMLIFEDEETVNDYLATDSNADDELSIAEFLVPFYRNAAVKEVKKCWSTAFDKYDKNNSGKLEVKEWEVLLMEIGVIDKRGAVAKALFENYDANGDKGLSKDELFVFLKEDMLEALQDPLKEYIKKVSDNY